MTPVYLLDTVIVIDHFNGVSAATEWLIDEGIGKSVISVITRAEVLAGAEAEDRKKVERLLGSFACLPITAPTADLSADLRKSHGWNATGRFSSCSCYRFSIETCDSQQQRLSA